MHALLNIEMTNFLAIREQENFAFPQYRIREDSPKQKHTHMTLIIKLRMKKKKKNEPRFLNLLNGWN